MAEQLTRCGRCKRKFAKGKGNVRLKSDYISAGYPLCTECAKELGIAEKGQPVNPEAFGREIILKRGK